MGWERESARCPRDDTLAICLMIPMQDSLGDLSPRLRGLYLADLDLVDPPLWAVRWLSDYCWGCYSSARPDGRCCREIPGGLC